MSKIAQFKDLEGDVDGVNTDFFVPAAYLPVDPDSEKVFARGIPRVKAWDDGWSVIDYATGHIRMNEAPLEGDPPPALLFLQDVGDVPVAEVTPISGCVRKQDELCGAVDATRKVRACVSQEAVLCPSNVRRLGVRGVLSVQRQLTGKVEDC
jgi:hypothetical protein